MPPKSTRSGKSSKRNEKRKSPRSSSSNKSNPASLPLSKVVDKPSFKTSPKKSVKGRVPSLEYGVDNLMSPAQLADGEYSPPARPVRRKLPNSTTSRLPKSIRQRTMQDDPDAMDLTEDVPWTRPSAERRSSPLPRSTEPGQHAAVDAFANSMRFPARRRIQYENAPLVPRDEAAFDPRPAQQVQDAALTPEFSDPGKQAEALLAGRTSTCSQPSHYSSGGGLKSHRTHLLDTLASLGYSFYAPGRPLPTLTNAERLQMMQSTDPTAVLQNYDDYGILPRAARPRFPAFKLPRYGGETIVREYWRWYEVTCLAAEKEAVARWARVLFLRANDVSEEELKYNESLGLVDYKYRVVGPLHRIGGGDENDVLPDYDREEVDDELEDVIRDDQGRSLGRPVRQFWKNSVPSHVFAEDVEDFENALDAYWDYHDCGLIPKGVQKYVPYPQHEAPREAGDLFDHPIEYDYGRSSPQISAIQERQWQNRLRHAEQKYIYTWTKILRAKELGITPGEFDEYLSTGGIDLAWSGVNIKHRRRNARSAAPAPQTAESSSQIQQILFSFSSHNRSYRTNALHAGIITTPSTPIPTRSAGPAVLSLHAYNTTGTLPANYTQPRFPRVLGRDEFESREEYERYLWGYEKECRGLEQNEVLRFLRDSRAGELGLGYEEFKKNRGQGRIAGYGEGWKVVGTLVRD